MPARTKYSPMKNNLTSWLLGVILIITASPLFLVLARTVYVQNPSTRLLSAPAMQAGGPKLPVGSSLGVKGQQGLFLKVQSTSNSGWVPGLYVSASPPGQRVNFGTAIDRSTAAKARARAGTFSQTAAARGYASTQTMRPRGNRADFDFTSIEWMEAIQFSDEERTEFERINAGH
ncbi:MAG: hypothetical protein KDK39_16100 [Leptospiraceae bacterium]|nr:hypothetical protein [Leptospiraceae bacterium]